MSRDIRHGATDQSTVIRIVDSGDGTPEESVEHNTSGISLWYRREGGAVTAITPAALAAADSAHSDGGIEHLDDGYYRVDVPDAAFASGATGVLIGGTVTGMVVIGAYHHLVAWNDQDTVRGGLTALPNAAADAAGGLPISDAGGLDLDAQLANLYHADIQFTRDQANTQDEWSVTWFKNGARVTSGITSPTLQVIKRADGTDLVASTAMTEVGSTASYKYDATTTARVTVGEAVIAVAGATIDGSARSFAKLIGRDSSA